MAKSIAVRLGSEASSFSFARLDRTKLYGRKERQVVDEQGRRCAAAWLSADGAALVPGGGLAMLYVDDGFATIERSALKTVDDAGAELALQLSTLGVEQELSGPLPAQQILDHRIHTVYQLQPDALGEHLGAELSKGGIYSAPFNFRDDFERQVLFLVRNEAGIFALVGTPSGFSFVRRDAIPVAPAADDGDELADDLDFTML